MSKLAPMSTDPHPRSPAPGAVRVGDRERAAAAERLSGHAAAGRLDVEELEARLDRAHRARYAADLQALESDLPSAPRRVRRAPAFPALPLALLAAAIALTVAVGHPVVPLFAASLLLWRFGLPVPVRSWS